MVDTIANWFKSLTLSDVGSYFSIAGFVLSIITLGFVYIIKKRLKSKVRIPELLHELEMISSNISKSVGVPIGKDNKANLYKNLAECKSLMDKLSFYVDKSISSEIKELTSKLKTKKYFCFKVFGCYDITEFTEKDIDDVYIRLNKINSKVKQELKDQRIE